MTRTLANTPAGLPVRERPLIGLAAITLAAVLGLWCEVLALRSWKL